MIIFKRWSFINISSLMILKRYQQKNRIGQGPTGTVYLVEDLDNRNKLYALKQITHQKIKKNPQLIDYLDRGYKCMKEISSPSIVNVYQHLTENNNAYILMEYCSGGNLKDHIKQKLIISFKNAISIMVDIINGLQHIHSRGYAHNNIKLQNILVKKDGGNDVFKLSELSSSKQGKDTKNTCMGNLDFAAPEAFNTKTDFSAQKQKLDIWALGVLFYRMIAGQYPFNISSAQNKYEQLCKQARRLDFKNLFKYQKKSITYVQENSVKQLLKRLFDSSPITRISLQEIKKYSIFAEYFPSYQNVYLFYMTQKCQVEANRVDNWAQFFKKALEKEKNEKTKQNQEKANRLLTLNNVKKGEEFLREHGILQRKMGQLKFLKDIGDDFYNAKGIFLQGNISSLLFFNIFKYRVIILRNFSKLLNQKDLNTHFPGYKWSQFVDTQKFKNFSKQINELLETSKGTLADDVMKIRRNEIFSPSDGPFQKALSEQIDETSFKGLFKESYRYTTKQAYRLLRLKLREKSSRKLDYLIVISLIAHAFNNLIVDEQNFTIIFKEYLDSQKQTADSINYQKLRFWMMSCEKVSLDTICKHILEIYF